MKALSTRYPSNGILPLMIRDFPKSPMLSEWAEPNRRPTPPRSWRDKYRGIKRGVRGQSSFFVHFFFAALAVAGAAALECGLLEWCLLILCIGGVLTMELVNSAIETLFRGLDEAARNRWYHCLDIAAGAVFVASLTALTVGALIFINRFAKLLAQ